MGLPVAALFLLGTALSKRHHLTVADYAVVALCPALIVLLLASLVYFVVLCVYHGQYSSRLGYIWFMFILGAVGIARISIEQSRGYATGYAAVLGLATFLVLSRFQTFSGAAAALAPLVNLLLIATVWLLADRITYDCTLIDDDQDASGQGLLDGLSSPGTVDAGVTANAPSKRRRRGHQPGRTVLWLTAAALPLFGVGQFLLRSDPQLQRSAMVALAFYLFATLSLLVATSFLGIRRYLRQREVDMPANVSTAWLGGGVLLTAIILAVCFALPQPGRMLANFELPAALESADWLSPNRYGWGNEGTQRSDSDSAPGARRGDGEQPTPGNGQQQSTHQGSGQPGGEQGNGQETSSEQQGTEQNSSGQQGTDSAPDTNPSSGNNGQSSPPADHESPQSSRDSQSQDSSSAARQDPPDGDSHQQSSDSSRAIDQQSAESRSAPSPPSSTLSQFLPSLGGIIKLLVYAILITILAAFLWINRAALADFWRRLLEWLSGRGPAPEIATHPQPAAEISSPRPFSSFKNPLQSGADPRRAVVETFQAAEAWYREQGQPRKLDETPQEYVLRLRKLEATDRQVLLRLTDAYNRIVYGGGGASQRDLQSVQLVWQSFQSKFKESLQS